MCGTNKKKGGFKQRREDLENYILPGPRLGDDELKDLAG